MLDIIFTIVAWLLLGFLSFIAVCLAIILVLSPFWVVVTLRDMFRNSETDLAKTSALPKEVAEDEPRSSFATGAGRSR